MRAEHELLGVADYYDVTVGDIRRVNATWRYSEARSGIGKLVRFDWSAVDTFYEEDEEVLVHPRSPYVRVDILRSSRDVRVEVGGVVLASSTRPKMLFETFLPVRYYFPTDDVDMTLLASTNTVSSCPYKGTARYWSATVDESEVVDVAWCYEDPRPESSNIGGLISFFDTKVDLVVDGERV